MGLISFARRALDLIGVNSAAAPYRFAETQPMPIDDAWRELHEPLTQPVGRDEMMTVPGVLRARDMICNAATLPLIQIGQDNIVQPNELLAQFDPDVPNVVHLAQTFEDLFADAIAWWEVIARGPDNRPTSVRRRPVESVQLQDPNTTKMRAPLPHGRDPRDAVLYVDGREVAARNMIRFDSPKRPARVVVAQTIRQARSFGDAAAMYAANPRPLDYFTPKEGQPDPEKGLIRTFLREWRAFRKRHSTGYVPAWAELKAVDNVSPADLQLVQLWEHVAKQLAVALGLNPEDLGVAVTSRVYSNVVDERQNRINDVLSFFLRALTDRLGMDDITPPGSRIVPNLDDYLRADPKTRWEVYEIAHRIGAITVDRILQKEDEAPMTAAEKAAAKPPTPAPVAGSNVRQLPARAAANADQAATFADDATPAHVADMRVVGFAVDKETRTIRGRALPYGPTEVATKFWRKYRFESGALVVPKDVGRVKFLEDHSYGAAFGRAVSIDDGPEGLDIVMRVARGEHGDRMLALAEDGVKDGLSVGVDFEHADTIPDPLNKGVTLVRRAVLKEVSLTAMPAYDNARVTSVAASQDQPGKGTGVDDDANTNTSTAPPTSSPAPLQLGADQVMQMLGNPALQAAFAAYAGAGATPPADAPPVVDPAANALPGHLTASQTARVTAEPSPYQFGYTDQGDRVLVADTQRGEFDFSGDLLRCKRAGDLELDNPSTDAGRRVAAFFNAEFATVSTGDVNELNPTINRPDMYVDQRDYKYPLWNSVNKGAPPNGVQPFMFPKFNSSSGLIGPHTEGVEPAGGAFTVTNQTVTPTAYSGAADITRETFDMGGNPAISNLIWQQMLRSRREALEAATATFLATLTAATDINLGVAATDAALIAAWESAVADLQFIRGYDFEMFAVEKILYKKFAQAKLTSGEPAYPILNPSNRNGTSATRFRQLDLAGVIGTPSWALPSTAAAPNNSWLYDQSTVYGWSTPPQRLEFAGIDADGDYAPVAMIRIAAWGYQAFANTDIGGVRQVIYDETA
jgi:HK97 family phage prohead protease